MVIDFHVHGKISNKFPFDKEKFLLKIDEAQNGGMDSIALTEHCHAKNFFEGHDFLNTNYKLIEDYFDINGFKVFYGTEVTTKQKLDILFIGTPNLVIKLREQISKNYDDENFIDINDLFKISVIDELLVILAHPYRKHISFPKLDNNVLNKISALEFNSKDLYKNGIDETIESVTKLANKYNLPIVCGSDTHYYKQISTAKNILNKECKNIKEIKEEIESNNHIVKISEDLLTRVEEAIKMKKAICNK